MRVSTIVCLMGLFLACNPESTPLVEGEQPELGTTASAIVGADGGSIDLAGATLDIPAEALASNTEITVTVVDRDVPDSFSAYSRVFHFEPAGQVFDEPVTISLPYSGTPSRATIFWTSHGEGAFVALPTEVEGSRAVSRVTHFSDAFVGSGCEGDDCCDAANGELDVVLMIDNSHSMTEEQEALASQLPRMARVFATGDLDDDGEQDFPALNSVRVAVVSSDMGTGGFTIMTCDNPMGGDEAIFRDEGNTDMDGCDASYPLFAEFSADDGPDGVESFVQHVDCVGRADVSGCGFEQQLEATLLSVASDDEISGGQGDMANAGFLRDDSMLALVLLTDEGDCSASNMEMFNPARDDYGPMNIRCALNPEALYPVSRYVDGLRELRDDPRDVIFGAVAGVPMDLVSDPDDIDFDEILDDERMQHAVNPMNPNELLTSCESAFGQAYPPRRIVEVAQGLDGVVQSICERDFTPVIGAILERVASRARGECR